MARVVNSICTINVNGIYSETKKAMLKDFAKFNEIDILLLQEVVFTDFSFMFGYQSIVNLDENNRGTAILLKEGFEIQNVIKLCSGRGIACDVNGITLINVYAPSGNSNRQARNNFFTEELAMLCVSAKEHLILAGDFNCVLNRSDSQGTPNINMHLKQITEKLKIKDVWEKLKKSIEFTYVRNGSKSRIDRIYATEEILKKVTNIGIDLAPFSDHNAVTMKLVLSQQPILRGRTYWKMNRDLLIIEEVKCKFEKQWSAWKRNIPSYNDVAEWWEICAKKKIRSFFKYESFKKWRNEERKINMFFNCLNEYYHKEQLSVEDYQSIKYFKAAITTEYRKRLETKRNRFRGRTILEDEKMSMYHVMEERKRRENLHIASIEINENITLKEKDDILREVRNYYQGMFDGKNLSASAEENLENCNDSVSKLNDDDNELFEKEVTEEEIKMAIFSGARNKSPGSDGIPNEFYITFWNIIKKEFVEMIKAVLSRGFLTRSQYHGITVLVKKVNNAKNIKQFRPITLLNNDYKIIARMLANRMRPFLHKIIHPAQTAAVPGRSMITNVITIRDLLACKKVNRETGCLVAIDFKNAFDKVDHKYLFNQLIKMGFCEAGVKMIKTLYLRATTQVQVNGYYTQNIIVRNSIRQGCPLSVILYCITVNALIASLAKKLVIANDERDITTVTAYADDLSFFVENREQFIEARRIINQYCLQSGAEVNFKKSKYFNFGRQIDLKEYGLNCVNKIKILGIWFGNECNKMGEENYLPIVNSMTGIIRYSRVRNLNIQQRVWYIHTYLLSKLWYVAQVIMIPNKYVAKVNKLIGGYLWEGAIFRVPLPVLKLAKKQGGLGLCDVGKKCSGLLVKQTLNVCQSKNSFTRLWMQYWLEEVGGQNPPHMVSIPGNLQYVKCIITICMYNEELHESIVQYGFSDIDITSLKVFSKLNQLSIVKIRVEEKNKNVIWKNVWENLNNESLTSQVFSSWYKIVHDIVPVNQRLNKINLEQTSICKLCNGEDTLLHRLTSCNKVIGYWKYVRKKIAAILRTRDYNIKSGVLIYPDFKFPFKQRNNSLCWIIGNYCNFIFDINGHQEPSLNDYFQCEYYRINLQQRKRLFAKYLDVILEDD